MDTYDVLQLKVRPGHRTSLPARAGLTAVHVFDQHSIDAVNAALAAGRPLLLRGEPGTGKSQLAQAVAVELKLPFVSCVVDSRIEARDLLWRFDAVGRLAAAQVAGALNQSLDRLAERYFVDPGPLWWAFDWNGAREQEQRCRERTGIKASIPTAPAGWTPGQGAVVLIDEIDKADPDVPNGLLEALGEGRFSALGGARVTMHGQPPFVLITSNEERALPDAFVRRCLVLELALPREREGLVEQLARSIGPAHYPDVDEKVLVKAAELLDDDRRQARFRGLPPPGQAEYLDLVRVVARTSRVGGVAAQLEALERLSRFTYRKQGRQSDGLEHEP